MRTRMLHAHGHAHGLTARAVDIRMGIAVGFNVLFVLIEGCFGFLSNSVALIADAGHNLGDVLGLVCAWTAMYLGRRPPGGKFTYGLGRSSVLAALANAVLLLVAMRRHRMGGTRPHCRASGGCRRRRSPRSRPPASC